MKIKFYYPVGENTGKLWSSPFSDIIDSEKYDEGYSLYLTTSVRELDYINAVDRILNKISMLEKGEIEYFYGGTDIFTMDVYKDRVDFEYNWENEDWPDWSCTLEEYKRALLGKRAFLMLPKEKESYLEIKINDIE